MLSSVAKFLNASPVVLLYVGMAIYTICPRQITKGYAAFNILISLFITTSFLWWVG